MLTLGWSNENSFVPVNHCLLSDADDEKFLCDATHYDGRSLAGKRRKQSRCKATDIMLELIRSAQMTGFTAKYVLFGSRFSSPKTMLALKMERKLDTIAMIKKSSKIKYGYSRNKKRRGRYKSNFYYGKFELITNIF